MVRFSGFTKAVLSLFALLVGGGLLLCGLFLFHFWLFLVSPGSPHREVRQVEIAPGTGARGIALLLQDRGVVSNADLFYVLGRLRGSGHRLQAGEYAFQPLSTPDEIQDQIASGRVIVRCATIPEGATARDVARILQERGMASEEAFLKSTQDGKLIEALGIQATGLEGYLFPETYCFTKRDDASAIVKSMTRQFKRSLPPQWQARTALLKRSLQDVLIVASLVEKEAVVDAERALIAAVFYNRLKLNMPLQSDPTAVYDLPDFSGPVTAAHLRRTSPYNTYQIRGLPPGPICNPGAGSIRAALFPEDVSYLYFVSNHDGTHHFSDTYAEHRQAVHRARGVRDATTDVVSPDSIPIHEPPPSGLDGQVSENTSPQ